MRHSDKAHQAGVASFSEKYRAGLASERKEATAKVATDVGANPISHALQVFEETGDKRFADQALRDMNENISHAIETSQETGNPSFAQAALESMGKGTGIKR